jgi:hypothetical protein
MYRQTEALINDKVFMTITPRHKLPKLVADQSSSAIYKEKMSPHKSTRVT